MILSKNQSAREALEEIPLEAFLALYRSFRPTLNPLSIL